MHTSCEWRSSSTTSRISDCSHVKLTNSGLTAVFGWTRWAKGEKRGAAAAALGGCAPLQPASLALRQPPSNAKNCRNSSLNQRLTQAPEPCCAFSEETPAFSALPIRASWRPILRPRQPGCVFATAGEAQTLNSPPVGHFVTCLRRANCLSEWM